MAIIMSTKLAWPQHLRPQSHTEHAEVKKQARAPSSPPLDAQHNFTRFTDTYHANSNNLMSFNQGNIARTLDDTQFSIKGTMQE